MSQEQNATAQSTSAAEEASDAQAPQDFSPTTTAAAGTDAGAESSPAPAPAPAPATARQSAPAPVPAPAPAKPLPSAAAAPEVGGAGIVVRADASESLGIHVKAGGAVSSVITGSLADQGGVTRGYTITAIDGKPIAAGLAEADLVELLKARPIEVSFLKPAPTQEPADDASALNHTSTVAVPNADGHGSRQLSPTSGPSPLMPQKSTVSADPPGTVEAVFTEPPPLGIVWRVNHHPDGRQTLELVEIKPGSAASRQKELTAGLELTHVGGDPIAELAAADRIRDILDKIKDCPRPMTLTLGPADDASAPLEPAPAPAPEPEPELELELEPQPQPEPEPEPQAELELEPEPEPELDARFAAKPLPRSGRLKHKTPTSTPRRSARSLGRAHNFVLQTHGSQTASAPLVVGSSTRPVTTQVAAEPRRERRLAMPPKSKLQAVQDAQQTPPEPEPEPELEPEPLQAQTQVAAEPQPQPEPEPEPELLASRVLTMPGRAELQRQFVKQSLIELILRHKIPAAGAAAPENRDASLRRELDQMPLSALRRRALELKVDQDQLDAADDADDIKQSLIDLIVMHQTGNGTLDRSEVLSAAQELLPDLREAAATAAYRALGKDDSASVTADGFVGLVEHMVLFNNIWHERDATEENSHHCISEDEFCYDREKLATQQEAKRAYEQIMTTNGEVLFDDFCTWCVMQKFRRHQVSRHIEHQARELGIYNVRLRVESAATAALRTELHSLKLKALRKRAREAGVSRDLLEDANGQEDAKNAVVQLIVDASTSASSPTTFEMPLQLRLSQSDDYHAAVQLWRGPGCCVEAWSLAECRNLNFDREHCVFSMHTARTSQSATPRIVRMVLVDGVLAGRHILPTLTTAHNTISHANRSTRGSPSRHTPGHHRFPVIYNGQHHSLVLAKSDHELRHSKLVAPAEACDYMPLIQIWRGGTTCVKSWGRTDVCTWKLDVRTAALEFDPQASIFPFAHEETQYVPPLKLAVKGPESNRMDIVKLLGGTHVCRFVEGEYPSMLTGQGMQCCSFPFECSGRLASRRPLEPTGSSISILSPGHRRYPETHVGQPHSLDPVRNTLLTTGEDEIPEGVPEPTRRFGVLYRGEPVDLVIRPSHPAAAVQLWVDDERQRTRTTIEAEITGVRVQIDQLIVEKTTLKSKKGRGLKTPGGIAMIADKEGVPLQTLIDEFVFVTSCSEAHAQEWLQAGNLELHSAVDLFYEQCRRDSATRMARLLEDMGEVDVARKLHEAVIEDETAQLGGSHTDTPTTKGNLVRLLQNMGEVDAAIQKLKDRLVALERSLKQFPPDHCIGSWSRDACHTWDAEPKLHALHLDMESSIYELQIPDMDDDTSTLEEIVKVLRDSAIFALPGGDSDTILARRAAREKVQLKLRAAGVLGMRYSDTKTAEGNLERWHGVLTYQQIVDPFGPFAKHKKTGALSDKQHDTVQDAWAHVDAAQPYTHGRFIPQRLLCEPVELRTPISQAQVQALERAQQEMSEIQVGLSALLSSNDLISYSRSDRHAQSIIENEKRLKELERKIHILRTRVIKYTVVGLFQTYESEEVAGHDTEQTYKADVHHDALVDIVVDTSLAVKTTGSVDGMHVIRANGQHIDSKATLQKVVHEVSKSTPKFADFREPDRFSQEAIELTCIDDAVQAVLTFAIENDGRSCENDGEIPDNEPRLYAVHFQTEHDEHGGVVLPISRSSEPEPQPQPQPQPEPELATETETDDEDSDGDDSEEEPEPEVAGRGTLRRSTTTARNRAGDDERTLIVSTLTEEEGGDHCDEGDDLSDSDEEPEPEPEMEGGAKLRRSTTTARNRAGDDERTPIVSSLAEEEDDDDSDEDQDQPAPDSLSRNVSFASSENTSRPEEDMDGWVDGYDHMVVAAGLYHTTTRPETKATELHTLFPQMSRDTLARALEEADGDVEEARSRLEHRDSHAHHASTEDQLHLEPIQSSEELAGYDDDAADRGGPPDRESRSPFSGAEEDVVVKARRDMRNAELLDEYSDGKGWLDADDVSRILADVLGFDDFSDDYVQNLLRTFGESEGIYVARYDGQQARSPSTNEVIIEDRALEMWEFLDADERLAGGLEEDGDDLGDSEEGPEPEAEGGGKLRRSTTTARKRAGDDERTPIVSSLAEEEDDDGGGGGE